MKSVHIVSAGKCRAWEIDRTGNTLVLKVVSAFDGFEVVHENGRIMAEHEGPCNGQIVVTLTEEEAAGKLSIRLVPIKTAVDYVVEHSAPTAEEIEAKHVKELAARKPAPAIPDLASLALKKKKA